jgi:uncharacterized protein YaiL (DUF2058 family)
MASLQDQLLKAGLIDKNKARKANKERQKQANLVRKSGAKADNETRVLAQQERGKKLARDRELNLQKQQASNQKAIAAQVKQLIEMNKLDREQGEFPYNFIYKNKVKNIGVTAEQKNQLTLGRLAIVTLLVNREHRFEILPAVVAEKIAQRDTDAVVHLNQKVEMEENENDPYADFKIPDDLTW